MKKAFVATLFIIISLGIAFFGTILIPGPAGLYIGILLVALTLICLLFPKKKAK